MYGYYGNKYIPRKKEYEPLKPYDCFDELRREFCPIDPPINNIHFTLYAWVKINAYINLVGDLEVTGLAKIEDGNIITDVAILPQKAEGAYCTTESDTDIADFNRRLPKEDRGKWNLDWHSHVTMACVPSYTDEKNYKKMNQLRMGGGFPFIIVNQYQSSYAGWWFGDDYYQEISVSREDGNIDLEDLKSIYNECLKDVAEKVRKEKKEKITTTYNWTKQNQNNVAQTAQNKDNEYSALLAAPSCEKCNMLFLPGDKRFERHGRVICEICNDEVSAVLQTDGEEIYPQEEKCSFCGGELFTTDEYDSGLCQECLEECAEAERSDVDPQEIMPF